jgi:hypothetical protein
LSSGGFPQRIEQGQNDPAFHRKRGAAMAKKDGSPSGVDLRQAFDAVNELTERAKKPDFDGKSKTLNSSWRNKWYGDCSRLCIKFDFLDKWEDELKKRPTGDDNTIFTPNSLEDMLQTLDGVRDFLKLQATKAIKALQDEIDECKRKLDGYEKIVIDPKLARHS